MRTTLFSMALAVCSLCNSLFAQETTDTDLSRHNFFYAGQSKQRRMFIMKDGQVAWSYLNSICRQNNMTSRLSTTN